MEAGRVAGNGGQELTGYSDRWSVAQGEPVRFLISSDRSYEVDLVRLRHGDPRPGGPGLVETVVSHHGTRGALEQVATCGSYVEVPDAGRVGPVSAVSVQAWIWPTLPYGPVAQGIVSTLPAGGWALMIEPPGRLAMRLDRDDRSVTVALDEPLRARQWYFVCAVYDGQRVRLEQRPVVRGVSGPPDAAAVFDDVPRGPLAAASAGLLIGACDPRSHPQRRTRATGHFNGKIASPRVFFDTVLDDDAIAHLARQRPAGRIPGLQRYCAWDFTPRTDDLVPDDGPLRLHGRTVNLPTRAVTGPHWSGRETDFRVVPSQYDAIWFHDDDLEDVQWYADVEITVPDDLPSGVYAARVRAGDAVDRIPFFVRPAAGPTADVAVVFPTLTYLAYANQRGATDETLADAGLFGRPLTPDPRDHWLDRHPELGASLYDLHHDGGGRCISSRLRPIANLRPDHLNWVMQAPRHLGADLYLVDWLERQGVTWDALTDEDVDEYGQPLLDQYRVVLTGSHPEYVTERMRDAFEQHLTGGGRLMYLGGNGFYWVVDRLRPHAMEVRRGMAGTRVWESLPGELQLTCGLPGGLWRHRGRPPNTLVGVGFAGEGWDERARGYRRRPASYDPAYAWVFDGVDAEVVGEHGRVMGGAAGDELDRCDESLGSPAAAVVLASSEGHSRFYQPATEDVPMVVAGLDGASNPRIRADMTLLELPGGGAVFSAGSICWLGALAHNGYDNEIARITWNVLAAFRK